MKIYIAVYTTGWVRKELSLVLIQWLRKTEHEVYTDFVEEEPNEHARNSTVKRFLSTNCDFLLQIDADVVPSQNPLELVGLDKDIITCPCPIYQHKVIWNVYRVDSKGYWKPIELENEKGKIVEIDAGGTGCILIKRKVLETIKAPFERIFNEDGTEKLGLDLSFSRKAKEKGFEIYASVDHRCSHYKNLDLKLWL